MQLKFKLLFFLCFLFFSFNAFTQQTIQNIISNDEKFEIIVEKAETYFTLKANGKSLNELAVGEHRDGEYVKFCRWKNFWKDHLNPDGTLGDLSKHVKYSQLNSNARSSTNPYDNVVWSNISNSNFITGQISLGRTTSLAFHPTDPNTFYVGAAIGGIWRTTDGGQNYTPLGDELPFLAVSSIVVDQDNPNTIYIAVSDHVWYGPSGIGVYKSVDGGTTWSTTALSFDFTENIRTYWMAADPNDASKLFVTTSDGLYQTTNGFSTVTKINNLNCSEVHFKPGDSNTIYLGLRNGGFYRSTNGGSSFNLIADFGSSYLRIAVSNQNPDLVYVSHSTTLYKSSNAGVSFPNSEVLPQGNMVVSFSPQNTNEILIGNFEIYNSTNNGSNFNVITNWLGNNGLPLIHVDQRNIFINPLQNDLVYFCNDGGVYTYNVVSDQFIDLSDGLEITQYYDIATSQSNSNVVSGGSQDNGSMYRNASAVWNELAATGDGMNTEIDPTNENIIYWEYQNGAMRRFNGSSNSNISPPGENGNGAWETPYRLDPSNPNRLICGYTKIYESINQGNTWTAISTDLAGGNDLNHVAISKSNGNRIYAVRGSTIYVKDVSSNNWNTKPAPSGNISDIEVDPIDMDKVFITYSGYSDGQKVFVSEDAGDSWTNISGSLPNVPVGAIELYKDVEGAYFIGTDLGVYYRDEQASEWLEYGNLPHTRVTDIEIQYSDQLLRIGTHGRGVFEAAISIVVCGANDPDDDGDGICDLFDVCPFLDDNLIGSSCDDGDENTSGEIYTADCACENGMSNIETCAAAGSAGTGSDYIVNVSINDLNNTSGKTAYSDFRNLSTTLLDNTSYGLSIRLASVFPPDEAYAWIDYDQDGVFESNEEIIMSPFNSNNESVAEFTVPVLFNFGATTLRVRNIYGQPGNNDPCNNYFGEVEDYTIQLKDSCPFDRTISKEVFSAQESITIVAENNIYIDSSIIRPNAQLILDAGGTIFVGPDLDVDAGSNIKFLKVGCSQ